MSTLLLGQVLIKFSQQMDHSPEISPCFEQVFASFFCDLFCDLFSSSTTTSTRSLCRRNFCDLFAIFLRSFFLRSCPLTANWLPQPARTTARLRRLSGKPTELSGEIPVRTAPRRSRAPAPQEANSRLLGAPRTHSSPG